MMLVSCTWHLTTRMLGDQDSDEWPPLLIFDVGFVEFSRKHTRGIYYAGGSERDEQLVHNCEGTKQKKTRNVSQLVRNTKDGEADDITCADMIMALLMRNAKKRPHPMKVDTPGESSNMAWICRVVIDSI